MCRRNAMMSSIVAASHLLTVSFILSTTCLIHRVTCFSLQRTFFASQSQRCRNNPLSSSSKDIITADQWRYHSSYNNDKDKIIHGRYNAVITKTSDLTNRWIGSFDPTTDISDGNSSSSSSSPTSPPIEALQAIQATHRWSDKFVCQLNLCPWTRNSLDEPNAICYWALLIDEEDDDGIILDKMEEIVREAGVQLTFATSGDETEEDGGRIIDPSVAISFIVLVPMNGRVNGNNEDSNALDFGSFHEFFIELEDRLLDECDDYWDIIDAANEEDDNEEVDKDDEAKGNNVPNVNSLGCDITIAAFHPNWQFNGSNEQSDGDAIDYEKRTPYSTISIVMSSVIESLREDGGGSDGDGTASSSAPATERIADLNEKTLCSIGVERLKEIFNEEVLGCPMKGEM